MLENINPENVLFLDIETVPVTYRYQDMDEVMRRLWDQKFRYLQNDSPEQMYKKAGIFAEFAKAVCISVGIFNKRAFRIKSFAGEDEKAVLQDFSELLNRHYCKPTSLLCAHNGKEFDFPFLARRMLINGIKLPVILSLQGKKPWEVNHLDTLELWKFGDYKNYTSLNLLAAVFNIPTPKGDMDGGDVARVFYEERDLPRIVNYCQKDVLTVAQLILRFKGEAILKEDEVIFA